MTVINQEAASRRFHQGLLYLLGMSKGGQEAVDPESFLAVVTVMAYLAAYVFPNDNMYAVKKKLVFTLEPFSDRTDVNAVVDKAVGLAQAFRRPWSEEPSRTDGRTI